MREIIFRGKGKYKDCWYYGNFIKHKRTCEYFVVDLDELIMRTDHQVDPDTVGQFTGLTDKNGKKIFEGDIIKMHYFYENFDPVTLGVSEDENEIVGIVRCELLDGFFVEELNSDSIGYLQWVQEPEEELEIIGNIYDNPEMIKENEDD